MALVEDKYTESTDGIKKTIDKNSMGMALDILQRGLYAYPIQSTVRELASNGYDAIKEREVAKGILLGTTTVEDHFDVTKIDGVFHASGWDPTYFDLDWLSDDPNTYLYYEEGDQKDALRIVDHGVGLGKTRLVNYFMLNWSSKRANKDSLGRFGLGSKVALSLGVESFRVITKYNGRKFKFDVFLDKVESIIPKFSTKGQANEPFVLVPEKTTIDEDGNTVVVPAYIAYWEPTTDKNGVEIQIEVKKHNKKLFHEAIEAQLMYMPNIKFMYRELGKSIHVEKPIAAVILYRDANVIISQSTIFNKPHVLLGTGNALINYGFVSFKDLEIEPKNGSVGLIMDINEIEVTPSRESPMWSAKTRAAVLAKYKMVSAMASDYLNKELSTETDYLRWVSKAAQILGSMRSGRGSNDTILSRLASIIDMDDIGSVSYPKDSRIRFDDKPRQMFGESLTVRSISYDNYRKKVTRKNVEDLSALSRDVYFTKLGSNPFRDRYIYEEKGGYFVLINVKENADLDAKGTLVTGSAMLDYDAVVIPQDRMDLYLAEAQDLTEDDADTITKSSYVATDYAANRKVNKQIVVHHMEDGGSTYDYRFTTEDVYITDLFSRYSDKLVVYTAGGDREIMSNILALFPKPMLSIRSESAFNDFVKGCAHTILPTAHRLTGILIAQDNIKYIKNSSKYMSLADLIVKSYNPKTEALEISDLLKFTFTNSVLCSLFDEKLGKVAGSMYKKQINFIDEKFHTFAKFYSNYLRKGCYEMAPRDVMRKDGFFKDLVMYQLYKSGTLSASDETCEELLKKINADVPDYLCDVIDNIAEVDVLNLPLIQEWLGIFDYYGPHKYLLELVSAFNDYDQQGLKDMAPSVQGYYKLVNGIT
jgi:hypothetical protein